LCAWWHGTHRLLLLHYNVSEIFLIHTNSSFCGTNSVGITSQSTWPKKIEVQEVLISQRFYFLIAKWRFVGADSLINWLEFLEQMLGEDYQILDIDDSVAPRHRAYIAKRIIRAPVVHYNAHVRSINNSISVEIDDGCY